MVDRTQEDINQDRRIADLEVALGKLTTRVDALSDVVKVRLNTHEQRLNKLDPLAALLEHVEHITTFFHRGPK